MGASSWHYFVPYEADIERALQNLREAVFRRGSYEPPAVTVESLQEVEDLYSELGDLVADEPDTPFRRQVLQTLLQGQPVPAPTTPDELLAISAFDGTHSIIDIPAANLLPALTATQADLIFGTQQPTRFQVEQALAAFSFDESFSGAGEGSI